ncbi:hypothetical protein PIB30_004964 [Stylosanthes scabra]|uniref:GRF-type domain-containing protein n=1 Tax=Stylosanthes scabra TaxID=79078 RepID=A0ABU6X5F6_9FABA|nr:hypothetical protein [Stylosanthes scabra]
MEDDRAALEEIQALNDDPNPSPPPSPASVPTNDGRVAPLRRDVNLIPSDEVASFPFPMSVQMEHWLSKICYDSALLAPTYFRNEVALAAGGIAYRYCVVLLGNPLGVGVHATSQFSPLEMDANEDDAFYMLQKILHATSQHIRDYNYLSAKALQRTNDHLRAEIERLEEKISFRGYDTDLEDVLPNIPLLVSGSGGERFCYCGLKAPLKVSRSFANPGREYYRCPGGRCGWFCWAVPAGEGSSPMAPHISDRFPQAF